MEKGLHNRAFCPPLLDRIFNYTAVLTCTQITPQLLSYSVTLSATPSVTLSGTQ